MAGAICAGRRNACAAAPFGRRVSVKFDPLWRKADMTAATTALSVRLRPLLAAICLGAAGALVAMPAQARGPDGIADVAEKVIDAVVNISTSQTRSEERRVGKGCRDRRKPES